MNRKWITRSVVAAASVALFASLAGTAQAAPGQGGGCLRPLVEAGTITQEQAYELREATDALKASGVQDRQAHQQALADLVANGTLTQSQADAIVAARPRRGPRPAPASSESTGARTTSPTASTPSYESYSQS